MSPNRTPSPNTTDIIFGSDIDQPIVPFHTEINNSSNNNNSPQYPYGISFTANMPSASTSKTDLSYYEKRTAHNALERQRREGLNTKFQELAHVLPGLQQVRRPSKSMIVTKSLEFVSTAFERETDFKGQLKALKKENEQLIRQADIIRRRIKKRKQKMANAAAAAASSSSTRTQKKSSLKKSPSAESLKSGDEAKSIEESRSIITSTRSSTSSSNSSSPAISSIEKKSSSIIVPTPKLVIRPRRTSSNLKPQVRSISLPCRTAGIIDHANFLPPASRVITTAAPTPTATTSKRQREDSESPDMSTNKLFFTSLSPPPTLPFSSSSSSSGTVHKKRRKSSESNTMTSSSSFVSPQTLTNYQPATFLTDEFMVNPMMNTPPSSSKKHKEPIAIRNPENIKSPSTSDFQFDIASLGAEQMFYNFDNHHDSSNTTSTVSTIPAVRMPIVNNTNNNNTNNNTMPTNNYTYVATDFLTSAILEDPEDHLFSWDS